MLLQNTVDPWANPLREKSRVVQWTGNRGLLHDKDRQICRYSNSQAWLCCAMSYKGTDRRPLFKPDLTTYSELFFLDEATAYAAGHRPCAECRRADFTRFKQYWAETKASRASGTPFLAKEIDAELHRERTDDGRSKRTYDAPWESLPAGAMFAVGGTPYLVRPGALYQWTPAGYLPAPPPATKKVAVLTPASIISMMKRGLQVQVHDSAMR